MFTKGNLAFREGRYEEAARFYKSAIKLFPEFYIYHENLGQALEVLGQKKEAIDAYQCALRLKNNSPRAKRALDRLTAKKVSTVCGSGKSWKDPEDVALIRNVKPENVQALKDEYMEKGLDKISDTFVLYRIIGNDLYPRHAKGQSRQNVEFILRNEQELPGCEKRWILNRIVDGGERASIIKLLDEYKQSYIEIPFLAEEFKQVEWDFSLFEKDGFFSSEEYLKLGSEQQERALTAVYRKKNCYLMHNNGARNLALKDGKKHAKWILPWDGNCFLTQEAWAEIVSDVKVSPHLKYFAVPMDRITDNDALLAADFIPEPAEEPQLIFRSDTREEFNPEYPYGRRPKVELFWRLGIPGKWDRWKDDPWDPKRLDISSDYRQFGVAGWVARLFSGQKSLEVQDQAGFRNRGLARQEAIRSTINYAVEDQRAQQKTNKCIYYSLSFLESNKETINQLLIKQADKALNKRNKSVTDKTEVAPSGDIHDYYHPAPYWWPNPDTKDGLPYIRKDGERVPGTVMYEAESIRYDRTSIQYLFDNGIALALAWKLTGNNKYARHAADALRKWFIDPKTRMNPHLIYSQVRRGRNKDQGNGRGNIETKDFYFYLDAVRILEESGALSSTDKVKFREWLSEFLDWLVTSKQGISECQAINNHGTYYDLQVAAIAAFLDERELLFKTLIRARNRLSVQISQEGWQYDEMKRTQTAHYCCFNLQGWLHLSLLAKKHGDDLFWHQESGVALLPQAVKWLSQYFDRNWSYEQIVEFNNDRFVPIAHLAEQMGMRLKYTPAFKRRMTQVATDKPRFYPHDAIAPYWQLLRNESSFKILHVVVMRFGIGIFDEKWLEHRFHLLQAITVPSLKQQDWHENAFFLVQVDELLSDDWLERLSALFEGLPFVIQKLQLHADRRIRLSDFCNEKCLEDNFTHVLTTRIDDDDAISSGFVDRLYCASVRMIVTGVECGAMGVKKTFRFLAEESKFLPVINKEPDAIGLSFLTLPNSNKNVYSYAHKKIRHKVNVFEWLEECSVIYTIHRLSDSDYSIRKKHFESNKACSVSGSELEVFGVDSSLLEMWRDIDRKYPVLSDFKTTEYIRSKEQKILAERHYLKKNGLDTSDALKQLLEERYILGKKIVSSLSL